MGREGAFVTGVALAGDVGGALGVVNSGIEGGSGGSGGSRGRASTLHALGFRAGAQR
jgi:hypothetical protein